MKLRSIEAEVKACRAAFARHPDAVIALHCHHGILGERLTEPPENRIQYILRSKPRNEQALRLKLFRPIPFKAYADWQKADADWQEAYADWQKAYADKQKADADWLKADADRQKAYADKQKAYADKLKADADRQEADADCLKAYADWLKADADWQEADADLISAQHKKLCRGCPWDGKTIFPEVPQR